jgi:hypothetical protein
MKTNIHFLSYLAKFFLEWDMFQTNVVEKITTRILYWAIFFFEISAVYEIIVQPDRPQTVQGACTVHAGYLSLKKTRNIW